MDNSAAATLRTEHDPLGQVNLPIDALCGAQTARAIINFPIQGRQIGRFPGPIKVLAQIKIAAARANLALGTLSKV